MATKKANPYRKTTRNGIPVYVSTTTGRVVKGPGLKRTAKRLVGAVKHSVKRTLKRVVKAVGNPKGTYSGMVTAATSKSRTILSAAAQDAPFPTRIVSTPAGYALKVEPRNKHRMQYLVKEWKSTKTAWENPKKSTAKTYTLVWSPTGEKIGIVTAQTKSAAIRKAPAPYRKYLGEIYAEETSKNPKRKTSTKPPAVGTAVGKSQYKATMDKAKALMPFPSIVAKKGTSYYLFVNAINVASARKILNAMAKTLAAAKK